MKTILLFLLMLSFLGKNSYAIDKIKKVVVSSFYYPPLIIGEKSNLGLNLDLMTYIFKQSNLDVEIKHVAFLRGLKEVEKCNFDAIAGVNGFHGKNTLLSKTIPIKLRFYFWVKENVNWKFTNIASLKTEPLWT